MTFDLQYTDSKTNARAGLITTAHGQIETPIFTIQSAGFLYVCFCLLVILFYALSSLVH